MPEKYPVIWSGDEAKLKIFLATSMLFLFSSFCFALNNKGVMQEGNGANFCLAQFEINKPEKTSKYCFFNLGRTELPP
jgi:hypothetical protein